MRSLLLAVLLAMPNPDNAYLESMRAAAKKMGGTLMRVGDTPSMLGSGIKTNTSRSLRSRTTTWATSWCSGAGTAA
jgi:hypothetical protein